MNIQRRRLVPFSLVNIMGDLGDIRRQLIDARPAIIGGFVAAAVLLGTAVIIHFWNGTSFGVLMRDPSSYSGAPPYIGAISNIGVMMWAATAAICLFTAWMAWRTGVDRENVRFLAWSGLGTLYLTLDDMLQLHESIVPDLTGLSEKVVIAAYVTTFVLYLVRFHGVILRAEYVLLGMALFFLGLSVGQDIVLPYNSHMQTFLEDAAKLFGIIFWLIFYVRTGGAAMSTRASSEQRLCPEAVR